MKLKFITKTINIGTPPKIGEKIENFYLIDDKLNKVKLSDLKKKWTIISFFPSLDTKVCSLQVKYFSDYVKKLKDIAMINVSVDLPFAQQRFCKENKISKKTHVLSDYRHDFASKTNLLIKEVHLLCRGVMVIDQKNVVKYLEISKNIVKQVNFKSLVKFIDSLK